MISKIENKSKLKKGSKITQINVKNPGPEIHFSTHLYLHQKGLKNIPNLNLDGIVVLYLHNNLIKEINNIKSSTLSSLYLQYNKIEKIESIDAINLKKLYLGNNSIAVVEGLSHLDQLEELHIGKQYINPGTFLCFDPRTVLSIAKSLQVLDITENDIVSIRCLSPLRHIRVIMAMNNKLNDMDELCEVLKSWYYLTEAWFTGNPLSKKHRYREDIIASTYCLEILDDKPISFATRNFIKNLENQKMKKSSKPTVNFADTHESLPKNYPPPLQKAVSQSLIQNKLHILGPLDVEPDTEKCHVRKQKKRNSSKNVSFNKPPSVRKNGKGHIIF